MSRHFVTTIVLGTGLAFLVPILVVSSQGTHLPGNQQGYQPPQPIAFSHRLHAGELEIQCLYCHGAAEQGRHAGIPTADTCMNCHDVVRAAWADVRAEDAAAEKEGRPAEAVVSPELAKLYEFLALDNDLKPLPGRQPEPIPWVRIHDLPDFVYFDHRAHVTAGVDCRECHGPVETMERVRQVESLSMGWCVDCHRRTSATGVGGSPVDASLDCAACHY